MRRSILAKRRKRTRNAVRKAAGEVLIELRTRKRQGIDVAIPIIRGDGKLGFKDPKTGTRHFVSPNQVFF